MAQYMIEVQHMPGQCLQAMDQCQQQSQQLLQATQFGCRSGVHASFCQVQADNQQQARQLLPQQQQQQARVVQVEQFTPQQIQQMQQAA